MPRDNSTSNECLVTYCIFYGKEHNMDKISKYIITKSTLNNFHLSSKQSSRTGSGALRSTSCNLKIAFNTKLKYLLTVSPDRLNRSLITRFLVWCAIMCKKIATCSSIHTSPSSFNLPSLQRRQHNIRNDLISTRR